ncbi:MAG: hypothetical protein AB7F75_08925 [Planctomycetota bacterium]
MISVRLTFLCMFLLQGCLGMGHEETGELRLVVDTRERSDLPVEALADSTMDWRRLPLIRAELRLRGAPERAPIQHVVHLHGRGPQPSGILFQQGDSLRLVNVSRRPLSIVTWYTQDPPYLLLHGAQMELSFPNHLVEGIVSDDADAFRLHVRSTAATVASFVTAHRNEWFKGLEPGSWTLELSHERIPTIMVPFTIEAGKVTRLLVPLEVGRLPPLIR